MASIGYIFLLTMVALVDPIFCHFDRDILITPNRTLQRPGKSVYFQPSSTAVRSHESASTADTTKNTESSKILQPVPWEEPLKHAIYLVLNNKVDDDVDITADTVDQTNSSTRTHPNEKYPKDSIYQAEYQRNKNHGKHVRFGDIIPLARGRLVRGGAKFVLIESDYESCMDKHSCKLTDEIPANVTALWMVEMVRHRNPSNGHLNELKLTVFPIKRSQSIDNKRETRRDRSNSPRSFVVRDKDYPKYFHLTGIPIIGEFDKTPKIQKRTFDMLASLTQNSFDEYQVPLHFKYNKKEELNTGEYFVDGDHNATPTVASYHNGHIYSSSTPYHTQVDHGYHTGQHIRFPTAEGITGPTTDVLDRISTTPLTATHLHHHFYLGQNHIVGNAIDKGHLFVNTPGPYSHGNLQHPKDSGLGSIYPRQPYTYEPAVASVGHTQVYPTGSGVPISFQDHQYHTQYAITEPVPHQSPPVGHYSQTNDIGHPYHTQLQIVSPQPNAVYNDPHVQLTTDADHHYSPNHLFTSQGQAHLSHSTEHNVPSTAGPFYGNFQLVNHHFSEPDPIFHQQVLQQHLTPHLLAHQYPYGHQHKQRTAIPSNIQRHPTHVPGTLDVIPLDNQGNAIQHTAPAAQPALQTGAGSFDIPPVKLQLEPDQNRSSYAQLEQTSPDANDATTTAQGDISGDNYPDSINAQLPPPNKNDDTTVPYVDSSIVDSQTSAEQPTQTIAPKSNRITPRQKLRTNELQRKNKRPDPEKAAMTSSSTTNSPYQPENIKRIRTRPKTTTTEKPILKWIPKRTRPRNELTAPADDQTTTILYPTTAFPTTTNIQTTTNPTFIIVTPTGDNEEETMTSISTSISIKVGDEKPHSITKYLANDVAQQLYHGFLPTIQPGVAGVVDVQQGDLKEIKTNASHLTLFRTSDSDTEKQEQPTSGTTANEKQIAQTILSHANGLK